MRVSAKKKNGEVTFDTLTVDVALPELVAPTPAASPASPAPAPQPEKGAESPAAKVEARAEERQMGEQQAKEQPVEVAKAVAEATPRRVAPSRATKSGVSLTGLLSGDAKTATELAAEEVAKKRVVVVDPRAEEKITLAKERMVEVLMHDRRRFVEAFQAMTVAANVVTLTVPSGELYTEIMRDKSEWQRFIAKHSGAEGLIELNVEVNEQVRVSRPITLEDRLRHMVNKNERIMEMIERMELDVE